MLRRLFVGVALIAAFASLGSFTRQPAAVEASPANQAASVTFSDHSDGSGEVIYFGRGENVVWAQLDYPGANSGSNLSYILRLNGWDYKWGKLSCGSKCNGGQIAFPLFNKDSKGKGIPGGAYALYFYDGDTEIARGGFGVKGGKGSDNDNDH